MQSTSLFKLVLLRKAPRPSLLKSSPIVQRCFSAQVTSGSGTQGATTTTTPDAGTDIISQFNPSEDVDTLLKMSEEQSEDSDGQKATISKAMHAYLKRAKEHQEFMDRQEKEFVFGRRHLANMMGKDPENFTQKDIDEAIRYLFPSGLYEPLARPMMRPPTEIYPKQKAAQFDISGRPHHPFFFTAKPNFFYLLHEMVGKLNVLNKLGYSKPTTTGEVSTTEEEDNLAGSRWLTKEELEERLLEKITDENYNEFSTCFERLANHPFRDKELEFIKAYRKPLSAQTSGIELPPVTLEPDGRKTVHVPLAMKKTARAEVLVTVPGNGEFKINGMGLDYFPSIQSRSCVIAPLQLVGMLGKCDIEARTIGGDIHHKHLHEFSNTPIRTVGETARASAVRWGIAVALAALGCDMEKLRLAGYLTRDNRLKERKKPGRDGARARWTWKKR